MQQLLWKITLILVLVFGINIVHAQPKQIIIIRHGDKLIQPMPGPTLSPQGIMRSILFGIYFENKFGDPDFIIASDPAKDSGKNSSLRELQTVAPLANLVASHHPQQGFAILHPYPNNQYEKLAQFLLKDSQFDNKLVLVCWDHTVIPQLTTLLGVTQSLAKWPSDDFDSVFIINYDSKGKVKRFTILNNQYEVKNKPTWQELANKIKA